MFEEMLDGSDSLPSNRLLYLYAILAGQDQLKDLLGNFVLLSTIRVL